MSLSFVSIEEGTTLSLSNVRYGYFDAKISGRGYNDGGFSAERNVFCGFNERDAAGFFNFWDLAAQGQSDIRWCSIESELELLVIEQSVNDIDLKVVIAQEFDSADTWSVSGSIYIDREWLLRNMETIKTFSQVIKECQRV